MGAGMSFNDDIGGVSLQLAIIGLKFQVDIAAEWQEYSESPPMQLHSDLYGP